MKTKKKTVCSTHLFSCFTILLYQLMKQKPVAPRFDPLRPNALVMMKPSAEHQRLNNIKKLDIVDVVVDPHVSQYLRPHQREGVQFLYECVMGYRGHAGKGAILADSMGLGKTLQCISLLYTLLKQGPYGGKPVIQRALVVCPSTLVKNWNKEFKKWLGSERLIAYPVSNNQRIEAYSTAQAIPVS